MTSKYRQGLEIAVLGTSPHRIESVSSETVERMRVLGYLQKGSVA